MLDWQTLVAIGALALSAFVVFSRAVDKSLTLREHQEFKDANAARSKIRDDAIAEAKRHIEDRVVIREFTEWCDQFRHDIQRVERAIAVLDQAKPTTGELQMATRALEVRLSIIEDRMKEMLRLSETKFKNNAR